MREYVNSVENVSGNVILNMWRDAGGGGVECFCGDPGGRLNKKDRLTGYGDSHVKDKTSYRPSYL